MSDQATFEHSAGFERGETSGDLRLGKLEMMYEELFAEVIEDGVITQDERAKLDKMAENLGLDRGRLRKLETALQAAWEARHKVVIKEMYENEEDRAGPVASIEPLQPVTDQQSLALQRRIHALETRVAELERDLEEARSQVTVEVDVSDFSNKAVPDDDPVELQRRLRHDPRDEHSLHSLYRVYEKKNDADAKWCVAQALVYLNQASPDERAHFNQFRETALIKPKSAPKCLPLMSVTVPRIRPLLDCASPMVHRRSRQPARVKALFVEKAPQDLMIKILLSSFQDLMIDTKSRSLLKQAGPKICTKKALGVSLDREVLAYVAVRRLKTDKGITASRRSDRSGAKREVLGRKPVGDGVSGPSDSRRCQL
jgi:hypothetical protein